MDAFQNAAAATVRVEFGSSAGSGFHFITPDTVLTNYHVILGAEHASSPVTAVTEQGARLPLKLVAFSPVDQHDFAVLTVQSPVPSGRQALTPSGHPLAARGTPVVFSGFPHGIPHLLVQGAVVSGFITPQVFYIDGSVNGGNSGGPILDGTDGSVLGIVTERRFLGAKDLGDLRTAAEQIRAHCQAIAGRGGVEIMGINFGAFSQLMAEGMLLIREVLEANANTGIGIGYSIEFAAAKCAELGIK